MLGYQTREDYGRMGFFTSPGGCVRDTRSAALSQASGSTAFDVRPPDCDATCQSASFSGGNQQKVIVARELAGEPTPPPPPPPPC